MKTKSPVPLSPLSEDTYSKIQQDFIEGRSGSMYQSLQNMKSELDTLTFIDLIGMIPQRLAQASVKRATYLKNQV